MKAEIRNQCIKGSNLSNNSSQTNVQSKNWVPFELKQKRAALELKIKQISNKEEDIERERTMMLKGFENCEEADARSLVMNRFWKLNCPEAEIFCKADYKNCIWAKFESQKSRNEAIEKCAQKKSNSGSRKFGQKRIAILRSGN